MTQKPNERTDPDPRSETAPGPEESLREYCARIAAETIRDCEARDKARALRETSFRRACESPAAVHCAASDRRHHQKDAASAVAKAVRPATEVP